VSSRERKLERSSGCGTRAIIRLWRTRAWLRDGLQLPREIRWDVPRLFTSLNVDRFLSKVLVKQLRELADSQWADLALTEGKLAQMLEPFGVGPGRIWSAEKRTPQSKQGQGYLRVWFEEAWRRYLDDEEQKHEPSRSAKILHLRGD
jgi:hypothetical protein